MTPIALSENSIDRRNNFDFIRLVFAAFVIISHSYDLTGNHNMDWLCDITNNQTTFADIGVKGFFIISGYLIFQSLQRSKGLLDYYWKRFLRVFPGLFFVLLLTVLLAPFVYSNETSYLMNKSVWTYIPKNLLLYKNQHGIDGVFETNPYKSTINGSLWTIPYEFTLYIALSALLVFINKPVILKIFTCLVLITLFIGKFFFVKDPDVYWYQISFNFLVNLSYYFFAGSLLAIIDIKSFNYKNTLLLLSSILFIASFVFKVYTYSNVILLPIIIILAGISSTPIINAISSKIGDLSYGVYIYGFPIQQTLIYFFAPSEIYLMSAAISIALVFAYFSWHLVEKKALGFKNFVFKKPVKL